MASQSVENYLKCIYSLQSNEDSGVSTNAIAERLETKPSSVSDMLKKLKLKGLVNYEKYRGANLTESGHKLAVNIVRKHRLWEVFLVEKLHFGWEEVHDMAEQLEHVQAPHLTIRLEEFLGHPRFDPHGDPIPDEDGNMVEHVSSIPLNELSVEKQGTLVGVLDTSRKFLEYLQQIKLTIGVSLEVITVFEYDRSMEILVADKRMTISHQAASNLLIQPIV